MRAVSGGIVRRPAARALGWTLARAAIGAALVVGATWACADFAAPEPPALPDTLQATPSFARDIAPVLDARCSTVACHNPSTHRVGLILAAAVSYDELVPTAPCTTSPRPNGCSRLKPPLALVQPGDANASWIVKMISPDSTEARAAVGTYRMPLGRPALTPNQIANIVTWITQGAARN